MRATNDKANAVDRKLLRYLNLIFAMIDGASCMSLRNDNYHSK